MALVAWVVRPIAAAGPLKGLNTPRNRDIGVIGCSYVHRGTPSPPARIDHCKGTTDVRSVRRTLAILLAATLAIGGSILAAPSASAATKLIKLDVAEGTLAVGDLSLDIGGDSGTASFLGVWNDATGAITNGTLAIAPQQVPLDDLGFPGQSLDVAMSQLGPATASIDPTTGAGVLSLKMRVAITGFILPSTCAIPEIPLNFSTDEPGSPFVLDGTPQSGTLAASGVAIPALATAGDFACGALAGVVNNELGLPITDGTALLDVVAGDPPLKPSAPTAPKATPGNQQVKVAWAAPNTDGGAPITNYRVTASPGGKTCTTKGQLTCTVKNLKNGTVHTFKIQAKNIAGFGNAATVKSTPRTTPGRPTGVKGAPLSKSVKVTWKAPTSNGGAPIKAYQVIAKPGTQKCSTTGQLSCVVKKLKPGTAYKFQVKARNAAGWGPLSLASAAVKPKR
jgi:hypothetical protein